MSFGSRKETAKNIIEDKKFRDFYTETHLKKSIPFQMRTMRTERNWSQTFAAEEVLGKGQNALSRLESPAYGRLTLQTLLEIAKAYDVGLIVKFVPYSRLLKEYEDVSFDALSAPSPTDKFPNEINNLNAWVDEKEDSGFWEEEMSEQEIISNSKEEKIGENKELNNRLVYIDGSLGYVKAGEPSPSYFWQLKDENSKTSAKIINRANTQEIKREQARV